MGRGPALHPLVVLLNRSYIISVIITFFYTAVNYIFSMNDLFHHPALRPEPGDAAPRAADLPVVLPVSRLFPMPAPRCCGLLERVSPYFFVTTAQAFLVTGAEAAVFLALIALVYKRQGV